MTTALLVKLEPDLHPNRINTLFGVLADFPGVVSVDDLSVVSRTTLDALLLKPGRAPRRRVRQRVRQRAGAA